MLFPVDPMSATALRNPEDFGEIMAVSRERIGAAKERTAWAAGVGIDMIAAQESFHGINKPETFLIGQEDSAALLCVSIPA